MAHTIADIRDEDRELILNNLSSLVDSVYQNSSGSSGFVENMQMINNDETPVCNPEGVSVSPVYADGTPKSEDRIRQEREMREEFESTRTRQTSPFLTQNDINHMSESYAGHRRNALMREYSDPANAYSRGTYIGADGIVKQTNTHQENVDWNHLSDNNAENLPDKINRLRSYVTYHVSKAFGFNNIKELAVDDERLIINGIIYTMNAPSEDLGDDFFPMNTREYIASGRLANFFDFSTLKKMHHLEVLIISDRNFYLTTIADDVGLSRRIGVSSIFRIVKSLEYFKLGSESITRDKVDKPESLAIKSVVRTGKRCLELTDKMRIGFVSCTDKIQDACVNELKNYIASRGNKSFLRFSLGVAVRGLIAADVAIRNFKVHVASEVVGGVIHTINKDEHSQ